MRTKISVDEKGKSLFVFHTVHLIVNLESSRDVALCSTQERDEPVDPSTREHDDQLSD